MDSQDAQLPQPSLRNLPTEDLTTGKYRLLREARSERHVARQSLVQGVKVLTTDQGGIPTAEAQTPQDSIPRTPETQR